MNKGDLEEKRPSAQELGMEPFRPTAFEVFYQEVYDELKQSQPTWDEATLHEWAEDAAGHMMAQERGQRGGEYMRRLNLWREQQNPSL